MKYLPLSQGKVAIVDDEDFEELSKFKWHFHKKPSDKTGYALRRRRAADGPGQSTVIRMHWVLAGKGCDHINGDGLDNRRANLRRADTCEQVWNTSPKQNRSTGYPGVTLIRDHRGRPAYCVARVTYRGKRMYLGVFETPEEAKEMRDFVADIFHGKFARG